MKGFCLAHSFLSHDRLYKLYVLRTVPTVFSVQLSNYISRCDEFVGEVNSELEPFVLYVQSNAIKFAPIYTICTRHSSYIEFSRASLVFGVSAPYPGL